MTASIVEVIQHYQRSIDNSQDNEDRLLYCIKKLYKLPIKVEHLQETGVGKTVNSLRKFNGEIGIAAKTLVTKWKAMVAAEEEPLDPTTHSNDNETHDNHNDEDSLPNDDVDRGDGEEDENRNQNADLKYEKLSGHIDIDQDRHKEHSSKENSRQHSSTSKHLEGKHRSSSTSSSRNKEHNHHNSSHGSRSSNSKEREKEKTERKSRDHQKDKDLEKFKERGGKHRDEKHKSERETKHDSTSHKNNSHSLKSKNNDRQSSSSLKDKSNKTKERSGKHKSSSRDKDNTKQEKSITTYNNKHERKSSSHKSSIKDSSVPPLDRKRRNTTSDSESNDFKSPQPKVAKVKRPIEPSSPRDEDEANSFDSSMGANFGDILGMLNAPAKISKKSHKCSSSSGSAKDSPKSSTSHNTSTKANGHKTSSVIYTPQPVPKLSTMKPDLLAPSAKLAPLDPNIALELPTISTNYKPMPLNQTVMDCVYNTSSSSSSKQVRTLTDDEAYQHGISSKTMRTKIYSGVKTGQVMQVPTLFDMCIRILQKNIDALEYTGGVPFEVLRPVLERATPLQLFIFEDFNPYLMEDSDVLWQTHVQRNYRTQKRVENESWREMFLRCQEEEDQRLSILKNTIKQSQKVAAAPVRKTQLAFIDTMVKPPRNVIRKQEQYGTKSKLVATPAARVASLQRVTPNAVKTGDQRLKVAPAVRDHAQIASSTARPKKAPLMQKTLAFMRGRLKR